jgi:hypothetical protein
MDMFFDRDGSEGLGHVVLLLNATAIPVMDTGIALADHHGCDRGHKAALPPIKQ